MRDARGMLESRPVTKRSVFLLGACALSLTACGGDDTNTGDPNAGMTCVPASMAPERTPPACPAGGNVCGCADQGPPDFNCATAGRTSPMTTDAQRTALERTNYWRTAAGLDPVNASPLLEEAARAHSQFMVDNPSSCWPGGHNETNAATCMGFTGATPGARIMRTGYRIGAAGEVINWESSPSRAIDLWVWSVYHRTPFVNNEYTEVGFATVSGTFGGRTTGFNTMEWARPSGTSAQPITRVVLLPPPGATSVPTSFQGNLEGPTPPRPMTGNWPSGPVISLTFPTTSFTVDTHRLLDGNCQEVVHSYFSAATDPNLGGNRRFVYFYADRPLTRATDYTAEVRGTLNGTPWSRVWRFRTSE